MASDSDTSPPLGDDLSVIAGIAAGDKQALAQLYDRYASVLAGVGMKILKDKAEVETLLHEVFVQVWQLRSQLRQRQDMAVFADV